MAGQNKRTYRAKAKEWGLGEFDTGTKYVGVLFTVLTPDAPDQEVSWRGFITDKTWERTVESLRYMGWKGDDLEEIANAQGGLDTNEVSIVVEDEEYEGNFYPRVQWVNKAGSGGAVQVPMSADGVKSFAAQMRARIRGYDASKGNKPAAQKPAAPRSAPQPPPPSDDFADDIPF